jgi:hypothetical protein
MGVKSDQQVEQKKGMLESPTRPLQKEHEVGSMKSRIRLKKCITPQGSKQSNFESHFFQGARAELSPLSITEWF